MNENIKNYIKIYIKKVVEFGEMTLKSIITYLYSIGCIIIIYKAYLWGRSIYLTSFYDREINYVQGGQNMLTIQTVNNLPLSILGFVVYCIVISIAWKLICELLYIIFERIGRK